MKIQIFQKFLKSENTSENSAQKTKVSRQKRLAKKKLVESNFTFVSIPFKSVHFRYLYRADGSCIESVKSSFIPTGDFIKTLSV